MTDIMESHDNETYEEPEDEVQEVRLNAGSCLDERESAAGSIRIRASVNNFQ